MKILQIINSFALEQGGAQRLALEFHRAYGERGVESHLLGLTSSPTHLAPQSYSLGLGSPYQKEALPRLLRFLRQPEWRDVDVIHVHLFPAQPLVALAVRVLGLKAKLVTTEHNTFNRRRRMRIGRWCDQVTYRRYARIACISRGTQETLASWLPETAPKLVTIPNGIDLSLYQSSERVAKNPVPVILSAGRLSEQKNYETALRAMELLGDQPFEYWIAGRDELDGKIQRLAAELGLQEQVRFLDFQSDMPSLLRRADIFLLSSLWEGFGLAVAEAMACGLPVIASDVPGVREVVGDQVLAGAGAGFLISPTDPRAFAERLNELLSNVSLRSEMGEAARRRAQLFDIRHTITCYLDLYQKSTEDSSATSAGENELLETRSAGVKTGQEA